MHIGVLKETKIDETRVALLPEHCARLASMGHQLSVETGAGHALHLDDSAYAAAGARIVPVGRAIDLAQFIVAIKRPPTDYIQRLSPGQILMCYLHLDENTPKEYAELLRLSGCTAIAYEWVERDRQHPLLEPMSRITGVLLALKSMELLLRHKGKVPLRYAGQQPIVMVIGIGNIGSQAVRVYDTNGCRLILVDKNPQTLPQRIGPEITARSRIIHFDGRDVPGSLAQLRAASDQCDIILVSAVRRPDLPRTICDHLLREEDVRRMGTGSVIMDATACIRDFVETGLPSEELESVYLTHGIVHYNPDHVPALAGVTSTKLLTDATFPFIQKIAAGGVAAALADAVLRTGIMVHKSAYRHRHTCQLKGYPFVPLDGPA